MRIELDAREREQIVDQARHAVGLRLHDREELFARGAVVLGRPLQRLDETGERGERCAQLVAPLVTKSARISSTRRCCGGRGSS
jgi:hypothetical protein